MTTATKNKTVQQPGEGDTMSLTISEDGSGTLHAGYGQTFRGGGTYMALSPRLAEAFRAAWSVGEQCPNLKTKWDHRENQYDLA